MSSMYKIFCRFAATSRTKKRGFLASPRTQSGTNNVNALEPIDSFTDSQRLPTIRDDKQNEIITHVYKGRKVISFDSSRSRLHIDNLILIKSCNATRRREGRILLEGKKLIKDAIVYGKAEPIAYYSWKPEYFTELPAEGVTSTVNFYVLCKRDYLRLSQLDTPQLVIALCRLPVHIPVSSESIPVHLICDGVRDPGNLGTLVRSAAAVGCRSVLTMKGSCDPWDPKVVRASAGYGFLIPINSYVSWGNVDTFLPPNTKFLVASNENADLSYDEVEWDQNQVSILKNGDESTPDGDKVDAVDDSEIALVVSNEGWGLSHQAMDVLEKRNSTYVTVPMNSNVDSLNCAVAASVILWELRKKYFESQIKPPF